MNTRLEPVYESERGRIRIALAGDAMVTRRMRPFREPPFLGLQELLTTADVSVANAEMMFHDGTPPPTHAPGGTYMYAAPQYIEELQWLGISAVCGANNHMYDFGESGLLQHIAHLRRAGLPFAGIGEDLGRARAATYIDTPGGRVALIGVTSSGPQALAAEYQWRDGPGRPGANMLRYTTVYTVPADVFTALRQMRDEMGLVGLARTGANYRWADLSYGASDIPDTEDSFYMADLGIRWQYPVPNGCRIVRGDHFGLELVPHADDLRDNLARVADARRMADWVIVSMHNHEAGHTEDEPSSMVESFARACVDAGADVFHGHGPHRDRAIEIYRGKPIFYSIGHFIVQNDTIDRVPRENLVRQGLDGWESLPSDFFESRSGRETDGELVRSAANAARWRDLVAVVEFDGQALRTIDLHPIDLGYQRPRTQRGRPVLASGAVADAVVSLVERLSEPYGTTVTRNGSTAQIVL